MNRFQKVATAATVALLVVIFAGAIVRATGSGLGCPDWPKCWGCWVPPTSVDEVDFSKIDLEKFKRKNASVTIESLRDEFNPVHVWIEYINRLIATPVSLLTLYVFILSFQFRKSRPRVWLAWHRPHCYHQHNWSEYHYTNHPDLYRKRQYVSIHLAESPQIMNQQPLSDFFTH